MQRRPEKEVMDDEANALAYARADFEQPHQQFIDFLRQRLGPVTPRRVLDLGCGPADISLRLARCFPHCQITAIDASRPMLALAHRAVNAAGLGSRIHLQHHYLSVRAPWQEGAYQLIVSNSLLHHLDDPQALWQTLAHHHERGTEIFVMDLLRPSSEAVARALVEHYAADEPRLLQDDFYNSLLAAYRVEEVQEQLWAAGLSLTVEQVSDRHLIVYGDVQSSQ